ncbi:MAG TPA: THxN family PEP-CTERM protein, partial [Actinomycetota bacterium]|nr:THxN family PEP-CTERM protein [Actinomycetota bacterium]
MALLTGLMLRQDSASALTLGSANGKWTAVGGGPDCVSGLNSNEVRWGDAGYSCGPVANRSGYRWDGGPAVTFSAGTSFLLGKFTHFNNPISGDPATSATLSLPLVFTDPVQNVNLSVIFNHHETSNDGSCEYGTNNGSGNNCADRVKLPNLADQQFQVGDNLYKLEFTGFRPLASDTACLASDPGGSEVDTFYTKEATTNRACIYAKLTFTAPVVSVAKTAVNGTVNQGQDAAFKITVSNASSPAATGWNLTDQLPAGFSWTINPAVAGCSIDANQLLTCANLTIPAGTAQTPGKLEITVKASTTGAKCEPIVNPKATISKTGKPSQDSSSATVNVVGCPVGPTVAKTAADIDPNTGGVQSYDATHAYWDITITNTAAGNAAIAGLVIDDGHPDAKLESVTPAGACTTIGASDPWTCNVAANGVVVLRVSRPLTAATNANNLCLPGTISNSASAVMPGGAILTVNPGGSTNASSIDIPGDPNACDKPGITKTANSQTTQDPADIKWTVTVTNPASGTGTDQDVWIKDSGVVVVSGPAFGGSATCTPNNAQANFQTQLNDSDGVACSMPNNSTITFTVAPDTTPVRTCDPQKFSNTAYLYIGSTGATPVPAVGGEITLEGDPTKCGRTLEVCKVVVGNGDGIVQGGEFKFTADGKDVALTANEPAGDATDGALGTEVCTKVEVGAGTVTVFEWNPPARPANWNGDDPLFPQNSVYGFGSKKETANVPADVSKVVFRNKTNPTQVKVNFRKYVCD